MSTPNFNWTEVLAAQNQKEVTINDVFQKIEDAFSETEDLTIDASNARTLTSVEYRENFFFRFTDAGSPPTALITLTVPSHKRGSFVVVNGTSQTMEVEIASQPLGSPTIAAGDTAVLFSDGVNVRGSTAVSDFLSLTDTPSTYSGQNSKSVRVNSGATALEFVTADPGEFLGSTIPTMNLLHVNQTETVGTAGGTATSGADQVRVLNTVKTNEIRLASLASNQITLPPGKYYVEASAPAFDVDGHKIHLYDTTGAAVLIVGTSSQARAGGTSDTTRANLQGVFQLAVTSVLELRHRVQTTQTTNGFGLAAVLLEERFSEVRIWEMITAGTDTASQAPVTNLMHVREEQANGVDGGTATAGSFVTRVFNTVVTNEIAGASLSSNQITLPPGAYWIYARAPGFDVGQMRIKLRDTTAPADLIFGANSFARSAGLDGMVDAVLSGRIELTVTTALEIQHRVLVTQASNGFGPNTAFGSDIEVYSEVMIWQVEADNFRKFQNDVVNGDAQVADKGTVFDDTTLVGNDDATILLNRHVYLAAGADTADVSQEATVIPTGGNFAWKYEVETANEKFGHLHILTAAQTKKYLNGKASLSFKARTTTGFILSNLRASILAWDSTADALTRDVVTAWGAVDVDPTLATNWTYEVAGSNLAITIDSYGIFKIENVDIDTANTTNIAVFIWVNDTTTTIGDLLYLTDIQIEPTSISSGYQRRTLEEEREACAPHFDSSFDPSVTPAQNAGIAGAISYRAIEAGVNNGGAMIRHKIKMFNDPTFVFFNPSRAAATWENITLAAASGAASLDLQGESGAHITNAQVGGDTVGDLIAVHYTAESEM